MKLSDEQFAIIKMDTDAWYGRNSFITNEYISELFTNQQGLCALTKVPLSLPQDKGRGKQAYTAALAKMSESRFTLVGNCQWVHRKNRAMLDEGYTSPYFSLLKEKYQQNKDYIIARDVPDWVDYFMGLAFMVAQRSKDGETQHGCILTDCHNHIISTGYNSFPPDMPDFVMPNVRKDNAKYKHMKHAELNAVINAVINPQRLLGGAIAYVTGQSCYDCLTTMWGAGIKQIYMADRQGSAQEKSYQDDLDFFLAVMPIEVIKITPSLDWIQEGLRAPWQEGFLTHRTDT